MAESYDDEFFNCFADDVITPPGRRMRGSVTIAAVGSLDRRLSRASARSRGTTR
jgi:hypothetical protein